MNKISCFKSLTDRYLPMIEEYFVKQFDGYKDSTLKDAAMYGFFSGGKRLRPILALMSGEHVGLKLQKILPFAFAIECLHAQSLIHDDMPALDNDALRRGQPCCHVKYGQGIALLAGDALLNFAYQAALSACENQNGLLALKYIADAMGFDGLLGGQALELECNGESKTLEQVFKMKTGALFRASIVAPLILAGLSASSIEKYQALAEGLGVLFQLSDDLLDVNPDKQPALLELKAKIQKQKQKCFELCQDVGGWADAEAFIDYVACRND